MSDEKFPERLRQARSNAGFKSPREAAQRFGWNENTYKSREGGIRGIPDQEQVRRYARAFRVPFLWLLTGQGELVDTAPTVAIVGKIGANAQPDAIAFAHEGGGYAFDYSAPVPPNFSEGTRALEVEGDSMRNIARDGWLIYYDDDEVQEPPGDNLFGELCICWLEDDRVLFKELQPGMGDGFYDLESSNAPTIRDVVVRKAARVTSIVPRGRRPGTDNLSAGRDARRRTPPASVARG